MTRKIEFDFDVGAVLNAFDVGATLGMASAGDFVVTQARAKAPQRTGQLVNSIQREPVEGSFTAGTLGVTIGAGAPYATFVEFGTGIFGPKKARIYPTTKKALSWEGPEGRITVRSTKGMPAKPYLVPAIEENEEAISQTIADSMDNELDKISRS
jgi:HK97 gp10 family phage protein